MSTKTQNNWRFTLLRRPGLSMECWNTILWWSVEASIIAAILNVALATSNSITNNSRSYTSQNRVRLNTRTCVYNSTLESHTRIRPVFYRTLLSYVVTRRKSPAGSVAAVLSHMLLGVALAMCGTAQLLPWGLYKYLYLSLFVYVLYPEEGR
jgi:hypothetical protein